MIWAQIVEVWINLAHVAALQSEHSVAIYIYQQTLQRFSARMPLDQRIDVHISLARELAIAEKYLECIRTLVKAAHLKPLSDPLWHNVAQMQRMFAHKTLEEAKDVLEKDLYDPTTLVERPGMAVRFARALCACARARACSSEAPACCCPSSATCVRMRSCAVSRTYWRALPRARRWRRSCGT